jgi:hypothetical protein
MEYLVAGDTGNLFHTLSEGYNFIKALQYSPRSKLTANQIDEILNLDFGADGNFWDVSIESLQNAKNKLTVAYPDLQDHADVL